MKKLLPVGFLVVLIAALFFNSCAKAPEPPSESTETLIQTYGLDKPLISVPGAAPAPVITIPRSTSTVRVPAPTPAPATVATPKQSGSGTDTSAYETDRMIVRTGNMALVVEDVPSIIDRITRLTQDFGGYVVSSNVWEEGTSSSVVKSGYPVVVTDGQEWKRFAGTISIRVPSERYEDAMRALRGLAVKVTSENSSSKDVTEEYVDLKAKLQNLEATEAQLLKLMQKAEKVEDILNVQRELSRVRGEIEQTKARMIYLERTSSTSLISVQLQQAKLDITFTATKSRVKKGETITFIPQIAGGIAPYNYEWDFGDGTTSTDRVAKHTYRKTATYTVSLKLTDDRGSNANEKRTDYITVLPGWNAGNTASGAWNALVVFAQVLADLFIRLIIFCPVWIIGGGIAYWVIRRKIARRQ